MKSTIVSITLLFFSKCVFSQSNPLYKDTLIFIPLGNSVIQSPIVNSEIETLSAGMFHYSTVDSKGKLNTYIDPSIPWLMPMSIDADVRSVAIGDIHSVVLYKSDSSINQYFITPSINAFYPSSLKRIVEIKAGSNMSIALSKKNIMYAWGPGKLVQNLNIPLKTYGVKTASVGKQHIAFINIKDRVFVWGNNNHAQRNIPVFKTKPVKIASGNYHIIALDQGKEVYVWGDNMYGQCMTPSIKEPVKLIDAKSNRSMIVSESNKIYVWGDGTEVNADFGFLGEVKKAVLGYDFAIILIRSTPDKIKQAYINKSDNIVKRMEQDTLMFARDSFNIKEKRVNAGDFIDIAFNDNFNTPLAFNGNTVDVQSINQSEQNDINSTTTVEFDGENNHLTIINDNVKTLRINSSQRVIVKGSNKSGVVHVRNQNNVIEDQTSVVVIDLDAIGKDNDNMAEYEQNKDATSSSQEEFLSLDSLPSSFITFYPIDNNEFYVDGEFMGYVNEFDVVEESVLLTGNNYAIAQMYFYYKQNAKGIEALKNGVLEKQSKLCALALFDIYYYGLYGQPVQLETAKKTFGIYSKL